MAITSVRNKMLFLSMITVILVSEVWLMCVSQQFRRRKMWKPFDNSLLWENLLQQYFSEYFFKYLNFFLIIKDYKMRKHLSF